MKENTAAWCQLELTLTAVGVDIEGYTQTNQKAREKVQSKRSLFSGLAKKISSARNVARKDQPPSVGACHIRIMRSEASYDSNEDCYASIRARDATMSMVQITDSCPTAADVAFQIIPLIAVPPLPAAVSFGFELWVELAGTSTMVAEAQCGSAELLLAPSYTVMLTSTLSGTADSKLVLDIKKSKRCVTFETFRTTCWMAQAFNMPTQLKVPSSVREEICESSLAFELPAKLLKIRSDDLHDELAMLQGKIGEVGAMMMDGVDGGATTIPASVNDESVPAVNTPRWAKERINKERKRVVECLEDLTYRAAGAISNYTLLVKYYTECFMMGQDTGLKREFTPQSCKRSMQRKDSALRAVTTNLHIHTVVIEPDASRTSTSSSDGAAISGTTSPGPTTPTTLDDEVFATGLATSKPSPASSSAQRPASHGVRSSYSIVTCGAPSAHAFGFVDGGLATMQHRLAELLAGYNQGSDHPTNPSPLYTSSCGFMDSLYDTGHLTVGEMLAKMQTEITIAKLAFEIRLRLDVVVGQALGFVLTAFALRVDEIVRDNDRQSITAMKTLGFLCSIESLLSTAGAEYKMIRDVEGALHIIQRYFDIAIREREPTEPHDTVVMERKPDRTGFTVWLLLSHAMWTALPSGEIKDGAAVAIVPVLFTQGVNEMQTISNMLGNVNLKLQRPSLFSKHGQNLNLRCVLVGYPGTWDPPGTLGAGGTNGLNQNRSRIPIL